MDRRITRAHTLIGAAAVCCLLVAPIAVAGSVGGSGGPEATASGVKKQIKKLKKKVKNLQAQVDDLQAQVDELAKQPGPQGPAGEQGEPGQPGQDATNLFAYIQDNGSASAVQYGSGVTAVSDPAGDSPYLVTFNRSLVNCVVQAVAGLGDPTGVGAVSSLSSPFIGMLEGNAAQVEVNFVDPAGMVTDTSFLITAFC
jgi:outer membrane murein-binding lipoprotein Lpp